MSSEGIEEEEKVEAETTAAVVGKKEHKRNVN